MNIKRLKIILTILVLTLFTASCEPVKHNTGTAAIAIPDKYGALISEKILLSGGNAVDAAIAAGFSLAVTYIDAGNIGGGGLMLIQMNGETAF